MTTAVETRELKDIASWMIPVKQTNLPNVLKGVFFMDGNPLPDDCITMYNLEWDAQNRSIDLPVFTPLQWTFHNSISGWLLLRGTELSQFTYRIQFEDDTLQKAQITAYAFGIPIPKWILNARMSQVNNSNNGDTWERKNVWLSIIPKLGDYILRRIVDADGCYTPAFNDMLTKVQNECLVVTENSD
jgi:hypothetical protein